MARYRKKSAVIEAFKYDGDFINRHGEYYVPDWAAKAYETGVMFFGSTHTEGPPDELFIKTPEGALHVPVGDYVIRGINGELHPCKSEIFEESYEPEGKLDEGKI